MIDHWMISDDYRKTRKKFALVTISTKVHTNFSTNMNSNDQLMTSDDPGSTCKNSPLDGDYTEFLSPYEPLH